MSNSIVEYSNKTHLMNPILLNVMEELDNVMTDSTNIIKNILNEECVDKKLQLSAIETGIKIRKQLLAEMDYELRKAELAEKNNSKESDSDEIDYTVEEDATTD